MFPKNINLIVIFFLFQSSASFAQSLDDKIEWTVEFAAKQMLNTIQEINNDSTLHPNQTILNNGAWESSDRKWWTSGFFPGAAWYLYELTFNDTSWIDIAKRWTEDLEQQQYDTGSHDIGFQIFCSYGNGFRITKDEEYKSIILTAANSLATRFNPTIGLIRSWSWGSWNYPVIIDNMMNLELLLWASENGGSEELKSIAVSHAKKTIENHIRNNGSTYHVVDYNSDGSVKGKSTHQGYSTESTWSRGQAWGIYGFTVMYRYTKNDTFLTAAENLSDYFINNLSNDYIPYSDFDDPGIPNTTKDASAAAIACSALLELQKYSGNLKYGNAAIKILNSLLDNYLSKNSDLHSILKKTTTRYGDSERGLIYADYYLLEAMKRYRDSMVSVQYKNKSGKVGFNLEQNYPNPFNPSTIIKYTVSSADVLSRVTIKVYDALGRIVTTVVDEDKHAGNYSVNFDASGLPSGIYFYQMINNNLNKTKKMVVIR